MKNKTFYISLASLILTLLHIIDVLVFQGELNIFSYISFLLLPVTIIICIFSYREVKKMKFPRPKINLHKAFLDVALYVQNASRKEFKNGLVFSIPAYDWLFYHPMLLQFTEFCFIGALGVGTNYLFYWLFGSDIFAWFLGVFIASIQNYLLNKWLVFTNE